MDDRHTPVRAPRLVRRALAIAALAIPAAFAPSAASATTVSMGTTHGCSVADTSQATCWGSLPVQDQGTFTVKDIRVGLDFSCAQLSSGVRCWGNNDVGQLGTTTVEPKGQWVEGVDITSQIAVGARHACALYWGQLTCWGDASQGQLGEPTRKTVTRATPVPGLANVTHVAAGRGATCAVQDYGKVVCVGAGSGLAGAADAPGAPRAVPGISDAVEVALFDGHACVLRKEGKVSCWGDNRFGELGVPASNGAQTTAVEVTGLGAAAKAVSVGSGFSCALLANGSVKCWGNNANGQLGTALGGAATDLVTGITGATAISAGQTAACAVLQGGYVQCWGQGTGWGGGTCGVLGGAYPEHPASWPPIVDIAICRPSGSFAPMAVKGLGAASDAAHVLDWAEKTLPGTFPRQGTGVPDPGNVPLFHLRQYPGGHALSVNAHGTPHLLYLGPISEGRLLDLGPLGRWLGEARQQEGLQSGMQLQARPYLDLMPMIAGGPCTNFLVPFALRGGVQGLPAGLIVTGVRVENTGGTTMDFPIRSQYRSERLTTDTDWMSERLPQPGQPLPAGMKQEPVLSGIAEGCPVAVRPGNTVDVTVLYSLGNRKGLLRARATVDAAY